MAEVNSKKRKRAKNRKTKNQKNSQHEGANQSIHSNKKKLRKESEVHEQKQQLSASAKRPKPSNFLDALRARLSGGHFRMINEKLYTCTGEEALNYFREDPELFDMYHAGYQEQMSNWPEQPVKLIIEWIRDQNSSLVVADFGCGDARISKSVKNKVFSFDLVAKDPSVIACDMSQIPLDSSSVDVAVFCLSLMGTNYSTYLKEAHRVLKPSGWLLIAEVKSRFDPTTGGADPNGFVKAVSDLGYTSILKDFSNKMFILFHFQKKDKNNAKVKEVEWPELKPCLYKRR